MFSFAEGSERTESVALEAPLGMRSTSEMKSASKPRRFE
jgi:hypothetical protein